jgi:hypothetical protein
MLAAHALMPDGAGVYVLLAEKVVVAAVVYTGLLAIARNAILREALGYLRHKKITNE